MLYLGEATGSQYLLHVLCQVAYHMYATQRTVASLTAAHLVRHRRIPSRSEGVQRRGRYPYTNTEILRIWFQQPPPGFSDYFPAPYLEFVAHYFQFVDSILHLWFMWCSGDMLEIASAHSCTDESHVFVNTIASLVTSEMMIGHMRSGCHIPSLIGSYRILCSAIMTDLGF